MTPTTRTSATNGRNSHRRSPLPFLVLALLPGSESGWRTVGRYADYDSAIQAHITDSLDQLDRNDGWLLTCEHLVLGPEDDGSIGCWPQLVSLGADPCSDWVPAPYDRAGWREWLEQSHALP